MRCACLKRLVNVTVILSLALALFAGCSGEDSNKTLLLVGEHKISVTEFTIYVQIVKTNLSNMYNTTIDYSAVDDRGNVLGDLVKEEAYNTLLFNTAYLDLAKKHGFKLDAEDRKYLKEVKDNFIAQSGGKRGYVARLLEMGLTDKRYDMINELYYSVAAARELLFGEGGPYALTQEEAAQVREAFAKDYINCSHILIATVDLVTQQELSSAVLAEKELKAAQVLAEVQSGEKDFDTLIRQYSDDIDAAVEPPYNMHFTYGEMDENFEEAAFALQVGEISGLVKSRFGYHIIKRLEPDNAYLVTLLEKAQEKKINETIYAHQQTLTVVTTNDFTALVVR